MGNRFTNNWTKREKEKSVVTKIKEMGTPQIGLKEQIADVTQRIDYQTRMLDAAEKRFEARDANIFQQIVKALATRDEARARILATELSEIRKVEKMLTHSSLALQSISMRLSTVSELGDVVTVLSPAKNLLNGIRSEMSNIMPEASQELGNIGNLLSDIVGSTCQSNDMPQNTILASADALQILEEAEVAAESKLKERIPDVATEPVRKRQASLET